MHQQTLFTPFRLQPYSLEAHKIELKIEILENLCCVYHFFNDGKPLEIDAKCKCGAGLRAFVNWLSGDSVAYCYECGWNQEVKLNFKEL